MVVKAHCAPSSLRSEEAGWDPVAKVLSDPALVSRVLLAAVGASGCEARQLVRGAAVCRAWANKSQLNY